LAAREGGAMSFHSCKRRHRRDDEDEGVAFGGEDVGIMSVHIGEKTGKDNGGKEK